MVVRYGMVLYGAIPFQYILLYMHTYKHFRRRRRLSGRPTAESGQKRLRISHSRVSRRSRYHTMDCHGLWYCANGTSMLHRNVVHSLFLEHVMQSHLSCENEANTGRYGRSRKSRNHFDETTSHPCLYIRTNTSLK